MIGFIRIRGKGGDWNVWSWKEMAWGKVKGMKKGIGQGSEKRAWNVSKNDGQGILELKLLVKA